MSRLLPSRLIILNRASAIFSCHRLETTNDKFWCSAWSASVSYIPLLTSLLKEPIPTAALAFALTRGCVNGGWYFCIYICYSSTHLKIGCPRSSKDPLPIHRSPWFNYRARRPLISQDTLSGNYRFIVMVSQSALRLSFVRCCLERLYPRRHLHSIQPTENQSVDRSYAQPFCGTSGAI